MSLEADVIVIGGGLSGLAAAYQFISKVPSFRIKVLEAHSLGGRILSTAVEVSSNQTCTFDLGGEWVSSSQTYIMDLIKEFELELIPQNFNGYHIAAMCAGNYALFKNDLPFYHINLISTLELRQFLAKIDSMCEKATVTCFQSAISMESYLCENLITQTARNTIRTFIRLSCGLDASNISLSTYLTYCKSTLGMTNQHACCNNGARQFRIKGGAVELCRKLASKITADNILTNVSVVKIKRLENRVEIETDKYTYTCSYVILAIPPKDLLNIKYDPMLPDYKISVLQEMGGGNILKFVITYNKAFWSAKGYSGYVLRYSDPMILTYDATYKDYPAIMGYSKHENHITKEELKSRILKQLAKYWGSDALSPIQFILAEWSNSTVCPWYFENIGCIQAYNALKRPVGRLYWAGTETSTFWNGYMEGAVHSGLRAATELIYNVRPQALSFQDVVYVLPIFCKIKRQRRFYWFQKYMTLTVTGFVLTATVIFSTIVIHKVIKEK